MKHVYRSSIRFPLLRWFYGLLAMMLISSALGPARIAYAASITVTTTADTIDAAATCPAVTLASLPGPDGQTSLREAVCAANNTAGADTITFSVNGTFALTGAANEDNGGTGDLDIKQSVTIQGNGITNTMIDGSGIERIFDVFPSAASTFNLSNVTLQNGDTRSTSFKEGGAIYLHNNVTTVIANTQIINNFSGANGAIENRGSLTINDSVISGNQTIPASGSVVGGGLHNAGSLSINNTTISNNSVRGEGGGIATTTGAAVTVSINNSTISGNTASVTGGGLGNGGGISTTGNQGTINLTNSTLSGNRADNNGGGAYFVTPGGGTGNATLNNVTITNNTADNDNNNAGTGGGFAQNTSPVTLRNTIVAGNFNSTTAVRDDINGAVVASSSYNLIGDGTGSTGITNGVNNNQVGSSGSPINPLLGALANNGGSTQTHALQTGSPAIDTANNATCAATDQRGQSRPKDGNGDTTVVCDIGAYELDVPPTATPTNTSTNTPVPPTATPTNTATNTPVPPTNTPTDTPTNTSVPPTNTPTDTPTNTPETPTSTPTDTPTNTPETPTSTPTDTPTNTPETSTSTPTDTPTNTPVAPTNTPTSTPTSTPGSNAVIYISPNASGKVDGIDYANEDILAYNPSTNHWSLYFDGSDVGLGKINLKDFEIRDGSLFLTFGSSINIPGLGWVTNSDIVKFKPDTLGTHTTGTFSLYFDGSDVGLTTGSEVIDTFGFAPDGRLVIGTVGSFQVPGPNHTTLNGKDEDLIVFNATHIGDDTAGTFDLYFRGAPVGLTNGSEDLSAVWIDPASGKLYLVTKGNFIATGTNGQLSGDRNDIFICTPAALGTNTQCALALFFDGEAHGFDKAIDGLFLAPRPVDSTMVITTAEVEQPVTPYEVRNDNPTTEADPELDEYDVETDPLDNPNLSQQLFLPIVTR